MEFSITSRLRHAWNAFNGVRDPTVYRRNIGDSYYYRPDRSRFTRGKDRTMVTSVFNRIAMDVASIKVVHAQLDKDDRFEHPLDTGLNECLNVSANLDQTGRAFMQDAALTLLDKGCIAIVAVDTTEDPRITDDYDINSMRVGTVVEWYPYDVKVNVYNEAVGRREDIILPKKNVAIVENPLYAVVNEPNSTVQRLIRKLALMDAIDEYSGSGKLDMIIQLPYSIKTAARRKMAEDKRREIADQLRESDYGIAYIDATEKITQLNRPVENNLLKQIEYHHNTMYSQLGITQSVMDGTADEKTMLNYHNRTVEPILSAIIDAMNRIFVSRTARGNHQRIVFFREPFKLVPVNEMAEIADKLTRNRILTSNEVRQIVGYKPSSDPEADKLVNSNIRQPDTKTTPVKQESEKPEEGGTSQNGKQ